MNYKIRELRDATGLTQKAFATQFDIPLSTLRKWEQGEASPAPYIVQLIARQLPSADDSLQRSTGKNGKGYYYDPAKRSVRDAYGNEIKVDEDLSDIKRQNLLIYLDDLFEAFYAARDRFKRDCRYDRKEDILWTR